MKIGIIKEWKMPADRRVVLSPAECEKLVKEFPDLEIKVESSNDRVFSDNEYTEKGFEVVDDVSDCDVLLGVKEVLKEKLIPNKKYFFFSHTIKKQAYNRDLLQEVLAKNIELYDHEVIVNKNNTRLVAFGRYAGIVGAYNGFRTYGLKFNLFNLPKATELHNQKMLIQELNKIQLPNIKIVLTGKGRVSNGAKEMLDGMNIREVTVNEYLNERFNEPVYVQIDVLDYNIRKDGQVKNEQDFFDNAKEYNSNFMRFAKVSDMYIACHFYGSGSPYIFTRDDAKSEDFNIKVVADISCDIDGPVASTIRPSIIARPIYGYLAKSEQEVDFRKPSAIAVMAVDNLPCELPKDASEGFGKSFSEHVIPAFFNNDKDGILQRARMTQNGKLTERFSYLQDFVDGK
ncbi:NAD(P)-dependent oxidoreductase [Lutibacter holmesii]|uniref:NAD(P)-dependent oxidoreductase n=1 Tax=Lutibacter holmesii TaxID=1137985 RepID=A0ABW3WPV0_9FLAO